MACVSRATDGVAPLRRPRVDAWALAATTAPSLLGLSSSDTEVRAEGGPSSTRAGAFASHGRAVQASWPGAAGCGQKALAPRLAAHLPAQDGDVDRRITPAVGAAIAHGSQRSALACGRIIFAVRCVFDAVADGNLA